MFEFQSVPPQWTCPRYLHTFSNLLLVVGICMLFPTCYWLWDQTAQVDKIPHVHEGYIFLNFKTGVSCVLSY